MIDRMPQTTTQPDDIQKLRRDLGLSQRTLAKHLGITAGYVALLESGKRTASERIAKRIQRLRESLLTTVGAVASVHPEYGDEPWSSEDLDAHGDDFAFVVFVGAHGVARSDAVGRWLASHAAQPDTVVASVDLSVVDDDAFSLYQALRERLVSHDRFHHRFPLELRPSATELLDSLERPNLPPVVLRFDNWNPRGMGAHQAVADIGIFARKVRVVASSHFPPPIVPGVSLIRVTSDAQAEGSTSTGVIQESPSLSDIERAVSDRRGKLPASLVRVVEGLDQRVLHAHPAVWIGLARELAHRPSSQDLERAKVEVDNILQVKLGDGLMWHALLTATDLAIIEHDYRRAEELVQRLVDLNGRSAGAFDVGPVLVMKARSLWEQSRFDEAIHALDAAAPRQPADMCRAANWNARTLLALGSVSRALRAAEVGARIAEDCDDQGGLAYSLTLAAQIEIPRGNLARARRLLMQALAASGDALELRVRPQILMQVAELDSLQGLPADADARIGEAFTSLADRPRRIWDSAYLALARCRIARDRLDRDLICSFAHALTFEAGVVSARAARHPVVAALHTEAAMAWVAAGYLHQAAIALSKAEECDADWLTELEREQVRLFTSDHERADYTRRGREIVSRALDAGAPYLATLIAYRLGAQVQAQWHEEAETLLRWVVEVAQARGWNRLAQSASALVPARAREAADVRGEWMTNPDGSSTLIAPNRGQIRARREPRPQLPDPFGDDGD